MLLKSNQKKQMQYAIVVINPPVVSNILNQIIDASNTFITITLDDYVIDIEDPNISITWIYT